MTLTTQILVIALIMNATLLLYLNWRFSVAAKIALRVAMRDGLKSDSTDKYHKVYKEVALKIWIPAVMFAIKYDIQPT